MTKIHFEENRLTVELKGRVDASNAPETEREICAAPGFETCQELVIDAEKLEYISSAGLRVILKLRKQVPSAEIINVSPEVHEVLDMTGFTELLPVKRAYRRLSVEDCEILGQGSNGVVYRYDPETIVKVYRNAGALPEIHRERELARKTFVLGIPTAIPYDVVKVGESYGSVFELLNARSYSKLIAAEPEKIDLYIGQFVDFLKKIHSTETPPDGLTDMKAVALDWAAFLKDYLDPALWEKLTGLIQAVPERHTLIHGDYHTNNLELQNGEPLLIDMDTLSFGHPVFELASMFLGFVGFGELDPEVIEKFMKLPFETTSYIWKKSLTLYLETEDANRIREVEEKAMVVGYARMMRRTIRRVGFEGEAGRKLIEHCRARLAELLPRVVTLAF